MLRRLPLLASAATLALALAGLPASAQDAPATLPEGAVTEPSIPGGVVPFEQTSYPADTAGYSDAGLPLPAFLAAGGAFDSSTPDLVITLGAGIEVSPAYFGSDEYETGPTGIARIDYLRFPNGFEYGSGRAVGFRTGLGLRGSMRYISNRNSSHYSEIRGLDNVPWAFEAGLGLGYEQRNYRVFGDVRYGIIGSNAWVGDLGADAIAYPVDGLTLTLGPRLNFGSTLFTNTYFGVSASESAASGLPEYDPSGGLLGGGVVLGARYLFNERWGLEGEASWERLLNDAADSPITALGSEDQYEVRLNLTRRISLDF
ncbi:MAG TPA: MipA/OmpV family protein [Amaricoccus sp.]|uniref:MipA/OmpV family protein n=1 Tax=Amaricoccus sp. TaxID=1872485 RepID=UPI001DF747D4|nr:MipA/OmpV family protein [Amaricoccus sp.]MCC0066057.1 MipA/OmpV family protein [Rhodovulum sp.]HPG22711.1 MipA/OmpV family protein [Amaricoccus sp.]HRW13797.1 MipA/OmpV family protein [Amaricoccus sp.]